MPEVETAVLVTGGAGYIGSHACRALRAAGFLPVSYDNLVYGHQEFVRWGPLVVGDIIDSDSVARTISEYNICAVIHFAAFAYVGESMTDPSRYYRNNVAGTVGLLDGMRQANCGLLVLSSTCAVYGEPTGDIINEQVSTNPINPYGRSKLMCEQIATDYASAYGLKRTALRYFNASGAAPGGNIGELRKAETHLIPRAMMALLGYIDDFEVFGNDFPTPDGTAIRDYIHVADLADAHVLALEKLLAGAKGGTYNLGAGQGFSVSEVLSCIMKVAGRTLSLPRGARRSGDPARLIADATLARQEIAFVPTMSDLSNIVETAWKWHLQAHPQRESGSSLSGKR